MIARLITDMHMEVTMSGNRFLRNKDLISQKVLTKIGIVGLGGIGSQLVPLLSIMGFKSIHGWDNDLLEEHNLSTTMYPQTALGKTKSEIAEGISKLYAVKPDNMKFYNKYYDETSPTMPNMIVCTDDMESRMTAYTRWREQSNRRLFLDLRMGAMAMEIVTTTKDDDNYLDTWVPTHSVEPEPCTMKHTIFTASIVGGIGVNQVFNVLAKRAYYQYIWIGLQPLTIRTDKLIYKG